MVEENPVHWCFAFHNEQTAVPPGKNRAAILKSAKWQPGETIRVGFLDKLDDNLMNQLRNVARSWTGPGMANLTLAFIDNPDQADVRIAFKEGNGSWSVIGTTCRTVRKDQPTMNFGWLRSQPSDLPRVVLHEFGHALGLIHEHQNPIGGIQWNRDAVYHDLEGPPNNWDRQTIDFNMFHSFPLSDVEGTPVDATSIMMYPIPKTWTLDGYSAGFNTNLSPQDKKFIQETYPGA